MKTKDVPQDLKYFKDKVVRDVMYAVDEDGRYTKVLSDGWSVKNDVLAVVWEDILEDCERIRRQVLRKEASPLAYHMKKHGQQSEEKKNLQDVAMLAVYAGIPKRKVRKHLKYEAFAGLADRILGQYADALRITVDELKRVE